MAKIRWLRPSRVMAGSIVFYCFMNDMKLHNKVLTHKYIDDITATESISESNKGHLQEAVNPIKKWSDDII